VLAVRDKDAWRYIGHVGTGFSHAMLEELHGKLEVKFTEWTSAGEMRHPAFLGLREDKKAVEVVLEKEEHPST
jgi:bifunctional non-homologous end joining protein LigD